MRILIVGAGVAGLTLADLLFTAGHQVVIAERAAHIRADGYMIDFFGPGYDVAERMNLLRELQHLQYPIARLTFRNARAQTWGLDYRNARAKWFEGRHLNCMRGDLIGVLHRRIYGHVPVRFGESLQSVHSTEQHVAVAFTGGGRENYDLVVGADGVSSKVRQLAFPFSDWKRVPLGYQAAAYTLERKERELQVFPSDVISSLSMVNRHVSVYPLRGDRLTAFFLHARGLGVARREDGDGVICADLRRIYGDLGWMVPAVLRACPGDGLYYDEVSQVEMDSWSRGRICLVGDACGCVSLVSGQGASLAMHGAWVLADEIGRTPSDPEAALHRYEDRVRPIVEIQQKTGRRMADWFVPRTEIRMAVRDALMRIASHRAFAGLARRSLLGR